MTPPLSSESEGSLLVAWQLKNKKVLIIGGGDVASGRITHVLGAGAHITLVSPSSGLHPLTQQYLSSSSHSSRITYHDRAFESSDLDGADMVLTAIDDVGVSRSIGEQCRKKKIPVNVADDPPFCDFYFGSQIRQGPLQIMISTNGQSPKLANLIRRKIEESIPDGAGAAIEKVGALRERLRERAPGVGGEVGKRRMRWMVEVCERWEMGELAGLDEGGMERLLEEGWERGVVLGPEEMGLREPEKAT